VVKAAQCKHQIAAKLAKATGRANEEVVDDAELAEKLLAGLLLQNGDAKGEVILECDLSAL